MSLGRCISYTLRVFGLTTSKNHNAEMGASPAHRAIPMPVCRWHVCSSYYSGSMMTMVQVLSVEKAPRGNS